MAVDEVFVEVRKNYLYIKVAGVRNSTSQLLTGTKAVYDLAKKFNRKNVLCDFSEIRFELGMAEAFNLVRIYETRFDDFKSLSIAGLVSSQDAELASFWEKISVKRGFNNKAFTDLNEAGEWLESLVNER